MARCLHPPLRIPNPDWQDVEKGPPALFSQRVEAHRLAGVRKRDVHYSSRRGPGCGRTAERRVSARRGRAGENNGHFEHPAWFFHDHTESSDWFSGAPELFFNSLLGTSVVYGVLNTCTGDYDC